MPSELRGTYLGICHPLIIEHLKSLGITSVQLMPVAGFMSEPRLEQLGLTNYWGYNPIAFFAPEPRYAAQEAVTEFKTMVRELHKAGLEVILDGLQPHRGVGLRWPHAPPSRVLTTQVTTLEAGRTAPTTLATPTSPAAATASI